MITKFQLACVLAVGTISGVANAGIISNSADYRPNVPIVDGSVDSRTLSLSDPGSSILSVTVTVNITKTDHGINPDGTAVTYGASSGNEEILLLLESPWGRSNQLIDAGTFSGQDTPVELVDLTFDDAAATAVGGNEILTGTFRPSEPLADFFGEDPTGDWKLTFRDTGPFNPRSPFSVNGWSITVETDSGTVDPTNGSVPEPASLAIFGAMALVACQRRRSPR